LPPSSMLVAVWSITARADEACQLRAPQTLFLDEPGPSGSVQENTAQFVPARQLVGHSIAVLLWRSYFWLEVRIISAVCFYPIDVYCGLLNNIWHYINRADH
jgi:hypothetical protein